MSEVPFTADASAAALLVVDLQNDFVREGAPQEVPDARATLPAVKALLGACREAGVPVLFTRYTAGPLTTHHGVVLARVRTPDVLVLAGRHAPVPRPSRPARGASGRR